MIDCKLHMLLAEKRMTQKELSEATGIGQNSISRYCNNTWVKFDKEHLDKLCIYFQCKVEDIITYKEDTVYINETLDEALVTLVLSRISCISLSRVFIYSEASINLFLSVFLTSLRYSSASSNVSFI